MRKPILAILAVAVVLATILAAGNGASPLKITTKRDDDRVEVKAEKDRTVISIHSPFGISQAVIAPTGKQWPEVVVLRLYLKGLENFEVANGKVLLGGSLSLHDGKPLMRQWKDGVWDLTPKSPDWVEVQAIDGGKPAIELPLQDGYFELRVPRALLQGSRKLTVGWIDFYRG